MRVQHRHQEMDRSVGAVHPLTAWHGLNLVLRTQAKGSHAASHPHNITGGERMQGA